MEWTPVFIVFTIFASIVAVVVGPSYLKSRERREVQLTVRHAVDKGQTLPPELIDAMTIWARFIYGPIIDDRVRSVADGIKPGEYGRKEAFRVRQLLKEKGPVKIPREFVFMDRAAIGLGAVFIHLRASINWHRLFESLIEDFDVEALALKVVEGDDPNVIVHNPKNRGIAAMLIEMPQEQGFPVALGVIYEDPRPTFEEAVIEQNRKVAEGKTPDLQALVSKGQTWMVEKEPREL